MLLLSPTGLKNGILCPEVVFYRHIEVDSYRYVVGFYEQIQVYRFYSWCHASEVRKPS